MEAVTASLQTAVAQMTPTRRSCTGKEKLSALCQRHQRHVPRSTQRFHPPDVGLHPPCPIIDQLGFSQSHQSRRPIASLSRVPASNSASLARTRGFVSITTREMPSSFSSHERGQHPSPGSCLGTGIHSTQHRERDRGGPRALSCHGLQAPAHLHDRITAFLSHSLTTSGLADCQDAALQPRVDLPHGSSSPSLVSLSASPCFDLRIGVLGQSQP